MVLCLLSNSGKIGREGNMPEGNRRTMSSWGRLGQVNTATQAVSLSPPESFILILRSSGQMGGSWHTLVYSLPSFVNPGSVFQGRWFWFLSQTSHAPSMTTLGGSNPKLL